MPLAFGPAQLYLAVRSGAFQLEDLCAIDRRGQGHAAFHPIAVPADARQPIASTREHLIVLVIAVEAGAQRQTMKRSVEVQRTSVDMIDK